MTCIYIGKIRFIPAYIIFTLNKKIFYDDFIVWKRYNKLSNKKDFTIFLYLFFRFKEYRNVFYYRMGFDSRLISWLAPGMNSLSINCLKIGKGLYIHHGHSTRLGASSIGENFQIWQNVTLGTAHPFTNEGGPKIGNNVKICTGAIVIGNITIGDNVTIGAGTIVVKSIPDNCVVVGNPARIIKRENHDI